MRKKVSNSGEEGNNEYKKGLWTVEEDKILMDYVKAHGKGHWNRIAKRLVSLCSFSIIALSLNILGCVGGGKNRHHIISFMNGLNVLVFYLIDLLLSIGS